MSDGGRESRRDSACESSTNRGDGDDDFARAASKVAVAQICESVGFHSARESALESLAGIAIRYLRDLGRTASFYANLAGRTQGNVFDLILGLEDLSPQHHLRGAHGSKCLANSGAVKEVAQYSGSAEEIPFAQPLPRFPVIRTPRAIPSFFQMSETPASQHVPGWLPAFPDPHTYIHTPVWNEKERDPRAEKIEWRRQMRKAEESLVSLQHRLSGHDPDGVASVHRVDAASALPMAESNPFLASARCSPTRDEGQSVSAVAPPNPYLAEPFQAGEKDVSPISPPAMDNRASVAEPFAPAIQAEKDGFMASGQCERNALRVKRPGVRFELRAAKKKCLDLSAMDHQAASFIAPTDEKSSKKRRAEPIHENRQEFAQR